MNEENVLEIETTITYETYKELFFLNVFKGKPYIKGIILFYVLVIWGIAATIVTYGFNPIGLMFIIFSIAVTYILLTVPKKSYNNSAKKIIKPIKYRFTKDHFSVESATDDTSGLFQINYEGICKIHETKKAIYIYRTSTMACILEKKDFDSEKLQLLRGLLQNKSANNYFQ